METSTNTLDLSAAIKLPDTDRLWVKNTTESSEETDGFPGEIFINVKDENDMVVVRVSNTWLPQDLAEQASRKAILNSQSFRKAYTNKMIEIITEDYAEELNLRPEADRARAELANEKRKVKEVVNESRRKISTNQSEISMDGVDDEEEEVEGVDASFKQRVNQYNSMPEEEAKLLVRSLRKLSLEKARYMAKHIKHPSVAAFIKRKLRDVDSEE
jgi:hypothetical protein